MAIVTSDLKGHYINGRWRDSDGEDISVFNPSDESILAHVSSAGSVELDEAVASARSAFLNWSTTPIQKRIELIRKIADGVESRAERFTELIVAEVGMPVGLSRRLQVDLAITDFRTTADSAEMHNFEREIGNSRIVEVPIGVVAAITPWNYPLHQIAVKISAALVAGCTVVLKPSEVTPLNALLLGQVIDEVGLPPGVINIIVGGSELGRRLVEHPGIDMVSFTGSPETGSHVAAKAGKALKPIKLELGGKGASLVLIDIDEANLVRAVRRTVSSSFLNSGQTCSALTRLIVPQHHLVTVESIARDAAESFICGDPSNPTTRMGPLISEKQRTRVLDYLKGAVDDGARIVTGGVLPPVTLPLGFFVQATVLSNVSSNMRIAQEEVFGPVLVVLGYETENEAIEIANSTRYGLTGAVWGNDKNHASEIAQQLRAGQIDINGGNYNPSAPFGGFGSSGFGRENGVTGISEFMTTQSFQY